MSFFRARWLALLSALVATVHAAVEAVGVDLVFPRNETYSPSDDFPVIFAVQNPQSAEVLNLRIDYRVRWGDFLNNHTIAWHDLQWANWSSADPYFAYSYFNLNTTRQLAVTWDLHWQSCDEKAPADANGAGVSNHHYSAVQYFTTDDSALKDVDLVAETADATCPNNINAVMINVTDTIMDSPTDVNTARRDTCVVTMNSTDSATRTTPDPCRVAIDEKTVASIAAARREKQCDPLRSLNPPEDCPADNGAPQHAALAVSSFLAAFGVLGFALL